MSSSRLIVWSAVLVVCVVGWFTWRHFFPPAQIPGSPGVSPSTNVAAVIVDKQPVIFFLRTFDPANPPADMPPLSPGEAAVCDSNFGVNTSVAGRAEHTDATDAIATVTKVTLTLQLEVTIWVPEGARQQVIDHEQGHRQIAEHFYDSAGRIGRQIALPYIGKTTLISFQAGAPGGEDINAALGKALQQMGGEITAEYGRELNSEPAQLKYDAVTDHARNDVTAADAIEQALRETSTDAVKPSAAN